MFLKGRSESLELLHFQYLSTRMKLDGKEKSHYLNLKKGYEGELKFDLLAEILREERYVINDLLLEVNNSYFQIDTLIISQEIIYLLDIKNYEGDFSLEADKLCALSTNREYKNPLYQLKRSESLFRQLLHNLNTDYLIEASIIFINPEFTLYHASVNYPIILPTQLNRFFYDLNRAQSRLNDGHKKLARKLISLHQTKNPFTVLPQYYYDQLRKGIYCNACKSFQISIKNTSFVCGVCGEYEKIEQAILRNVDEFKLLFPDRLITTLNIHDWCNPGLNKKTLCRILKKNFTANGSTRDTYYT
ncbi:nuclease-related domain-containing protein [Mesobacillus harenae]|uniref:nuclease-related domain-containing protein n=1 Tax=Mesobacillus harenae TaxID=2213203 RepID=UPI0015801482|nr:nuclease-related domain-containing protein [Mesobacillus harenae]